jgi:hypothetical protein
MVTSTFFKVEINDNTPLMFSSPRKIRGTVTQELLRKNSSFGRAINY